MAMSRGLQISIIVFGGIGTIFLLLGLGVDLGHWWPVLFTVLGLASIVRGIRERENMVLGFLMIGWSIAAIVALHHADLEAIRQPWLFFIGASIIWVPVAWLLGRALTPETGK